MNNSITNYLVLVAHAMKEIIIGPLLLFVLATIFAWCVLYFATIFPAIPQRVKDPCSKLCGAIYTPCKAVIITYIFLLFISWYMK